LVGTKPPLVHVIEALHTRVLLPDHQVSPKAQLNLPLIDSATKALTKPLGHLDVVSTNKELLHQERKSPCPPHTMSSPLHTKPESQRPAGDSLRPQGSDSTLYTLIHLRITSQG
jgi:hypothetical protein